jgi:hypothetical protein
LRARGIILLSAGVTYLVACALVCLAAAETRPRLKLAGFALMAAAYGVAALALLRPKDKGLTVLELGLLLGFGILFRVTFFAGSPEGLGSSLGFAVPEPPGAVPGPPGVPPQPPLGVMLSVWILAARSEAWIGYLFLALCELGTWALLLVMLEAGRESPAWLLLYVWNPLATVAGATPALGCATAFFLVLGLWFFQRRLPGRGVALMGFSAAGSYALLPVLLAVVGGPLRRKLMGLAAVAGLLASGVLVALLWPAWREALGQALRQGTQNAGPFALIEWLTRSRLAAWAVAAAICAFTGLAFGRGEPVPVSARTLQAAILSAPVVLAGGLYVLTPLLVLRPSAAWAGFSCVVLLLQVWFGGGPIPWPWLLVEYGGLAAGLLAERVLRRRGGPPAGAPSSPAVVAETSAESPGRAGYWGG